MAVKGEVAPGHKPSAAVRGRIPGFTFAKILTSHGGPGRGGGTCHSALAISSFMISLVPP